MCAGATVQVSPWHVIPQSHDTAINLLALSEKERKTERVTLALCDVYLSLFIQNTVLLCFLSNVFSSTSASSDGVLVWCPLLALCSLCPTVAHSHCTESQKQGCVTSEAGLCHYQASKRLDCPTLGSLTAKVIQ